MFLLKKRQLSAIRSDQSVLSGDCQTTVPPSGANLVAGELVAARLAWLARAGRSRDLAVLANQLLTRRAGQAGNAGLLNMN